VTLSLVAGPAHAVAAALPAHADGVRACAQGEVLVCAEISAAGRLAGVTLLASFAEAYRLRALRRAETGDAVEIRVV
jgi:hypothetical protein